MPVGPRDRRQPQRPGHDDDGALTAAYQQADLLLTLVNLDPSLGADNLPTWAPDAAVVVTAGRSTWLRINAVSEMVRMSGTKLAAAVLVGTDKSDESLGRSPAMPPQGPMVTSARGH
jgi:hypothetical protein